MGYQYDVFLSYKRNTPFETWVHKYFLPIFKPTLNEALNRESNIFCDIEQLAPGEAWPERLRQALALSRCLIGIWSPMYFHSDWCVNELATMRYREMRLKYRTKSNPSGLIVPVTVFDGENFPEPVKEIYYENFCKFARSSRGFKYTKAHAEFESKLYSWVPKVAPIIKNAPPWRKEWLEWVDNENIRDLKSKLLKAESEIKFQAPVLG